MSTEIPKLGAVLTAICFVAGVVLFLLLNSSFGGPTPISGLVSGEPYELRARFDDAEGLLSKSLVLVNGVQVGEVERVEVNDDRAVVTLTLEDRYAPVPEGTVARLGNRTVFGEKYVGLELPGGEPLPAAAEEEGIASGSELPTERLVLLDDALEVLGDERRDSLIRTLDELDRATRSPRAAEQLNATYAELGRLAGGLRLLTGELRGQEDEIAGLVDGSRTALGALGEREDALRRIVGAGRVTLEAIATQRDSLDASLGELPSTLAATRSSIDATRPLLLEARPLVEDLAVAAPELRPAVRDLGPVARDARAVIAGLRPLRKAAAPTVRAALPALDALLPVAEGLEPATANLVPVARHLGPRGDELSAFFANFGASTGRDAQGEWLRLFLINDGAGAVDPEIFSGAPVRECRPGFEPADVPFCNNAYPNPGDAAGNEPFDGAFPRLMPFAPPPPG